MPDEAIVDVLFPVAAGSLPGDHAQALAAALCDRLPWLAGEPLAAIHPIKGVIADSDPALLSQRARLTLRVRASRAPELAALAGSELSVAGQAVQLGAPTTRTLQPHATVYAYKVAAQDGGELAFMVAVDRELAQLGIRGHRVCGLQQRITVSGLAVDAFSLMVHGLAADASLRLQRHGLGPHRLLGCGVFVPHKSAAAVGTQDF